MARQLLAILAGLSTILLVLSAGAWVRTWFVTDHVHIGPWHPARRTFELGVRSGADFLNLDLKQHPYPKYHPADLARRHVAGFGIAHQTSPPREFGIDAWLWWDSYIDSPSRSGPARCWRVQTRPWFLVLIAAVLPSSWLMSVMRRRRLVRKGCCPACGYDLRASPLRCPECGTTRPDIVQVT